MLNYRKFRKFVLGKKYFALDDMLLDQGIIPTHEIRKDVSVFLREDGWERRGNTKESQVWKRIDPKEDVRLEIKKLETLGDRQQADLKMIRTLLDEGFTRDQVMMYIHLFYNSTFETISTFRDEEKECKDFAKRIETAVDSKSPCVRLIYWSALVFYTEKFFPELADEFFVHNARRRLKNALMIESETSREEVEYAALTAAPHYLDLVGKIDDARDGRDFKAWIIGQNLKESTIAKFLTYNIDWRMLSILCVIARGVAQGRDFSVPYGVKEEVAEEMHAYLEELHKKYGKRSKGKIMQKD